jgi:hypothetical protein
MANTKKLDPVGVDILIGRLNQVFRDRAELLVPTEPGKPSYAPTLRINPGTLTATVFGNTTQQFKIVATEPSSWDHLRAMFSLVVREAYANIEIQRLDTHGDNRRYYRLRTWDYAQNGEKAPIAEACDFMLLGQGPKSDPRAGLYPIYENE